MHWFYKLNDGRKKEFAIKDAFVSNLFENSDRESYTTVHDLT